MSSLAAIVDSFDLIGIDMPIGLSDDGPRACDRLARAFLSPRGSTVFPGPARSIIDLTEYAVANARSRSEHGRGLPRQTFALFPKIREVDRAARMAPGRFVEIHPECAFARMNGAVLGSKHHADGLARRRELVERHVGPFPGPLPGASEDDVLDAMAVLWSIRRYARGEHVTFTDGSTDARGLPMRIVS